MLNEQSLWPSPREPLKVARRIAQTRTTDGVCVIRRWRGDWLEWKLTHWETVEDATIRKLLYSTLEDAEYATKDEIKDWAPTRHKIANVTEALGAVTHLEDWRNPPEWTSYPSSYAVTPKPSQLVSAQNGLLDVSKRELIGHTPHLFNTVSVPFDYDPDAPPPEKWLAFLDQLWPDDSESIRALQQFVGYVLSGRTDLHKILLLVGPTRAGKGVIARVVGALVGRGNVAGPTLSSLGQNFGLQPLIGKPLAVISDARLGSGTSVIVERLLSISGEDWLTIDRKYREPWSGKLNTRFMIISNELPRFGDASGAIANRFVLLALRRSWLGEENPRLTSELLQELPGILNWALDGLEDLNESGTFIEPASSREAITALQDLTSPVSAFVRDDCVVGPEYEITKQDLWDAWKKWCENNGRNRPGTKATFGRDLMAAYPMITTTRPRDDGQRVNMYQGIDVKPQSPVTPTTPDHTPESTPVRDGQGDHALSPETPGAFNGDYCRCGNILSHYTRDGFPYCDDCGPPAQEATA